MQLLQVTICKSILENIQVTAIREGHPAVQRWLELVT